MIDLDRIDVRREVRKPNYGLTQVCIAEDDFNAMVHELRTLRALVAELEEDDKEARDAD